MLLTQDNFLKLRRREEEEFFIRNNSKLFTTYLEQDLYDYLNIHMQNYD